MGVGRIFGNGRAPLGKSSEHLRKVLGNPSEIVVFPPEIIGNPSESRREPNRTCLGNRTVHNRQKETEDT